MSDKPAPVVPIMPGVQIQQPRSLSLLEHVVTSLAAFEDDEEPVAIAFVIYGKDGKVQAGWQNDVEIGESALQALAGAKLLHLAGKDD